MKRNSAQLKQKLIVIGWLGLVIFALHASLFLLGAQHMTIASPCAGMSQAVCPILQYDLMSTELFITRLTEFEAPHAIKTIFNNTYILATLLLALSLFTGVWQNIRKRNYLFRLFHWYTQAFSRGILNSKKYALEPILV